MQTLQISPRNELPYRYVPSRRWRRLQPEQQTRLVGAARVVVIAYTRAQPCFSYEECTSELKWMQKCHTYKAQIGDIRYNFLIGGDATVYEGRGWWTQTFMPTKHLDPFTSTAILIGFMGMFHDEPPGQQMLEAQEELVRFGVKRNYIAKNFTQITLRSAAMFNRPLRLDPLDLVTREEWGAKPPRWTTPFAPGMQPVHHLVVQYAARHPSYHGETDMCALMRKLQANHMRDKDCPDINYNFIVDLEGRVYEGRGWRTIPTMPAKYYKIKDMSIFFGWMGRFEDQINPKEIEPSENLYNARRMLFMHGQRGKYLSHILRVYLVKLGNHRRKGDFSEEWE